MNSESGSLKIRKKGTIFDKCILKGIYVTEISKEHNVYNPFRIYYDEPLKNQYPGKIIIRKTWTEYSNLKVLPKGVFISFANKEIRND